MAEWPPCGRRGAIRVPARLSAGRRGLRTRRSRRGGQTRRPRRAPDDDGGHFEGAAAERFDERVHDVRIEVGAGAPDDDVLRVVRRHRLAIRAIARERIEHVGDAQDARLERNAVAAIRIVAGAVVLVVVREHDRDNPAERSADGLEHLHAPRHVLLHLIVFVARQARRLVEQLAADVQLPDVVEQRRGANVLHPLRRQPHRRRDRRGVDRHAIRVVLGVGVLRDEVAEDEQHAVIGLAQFIDLRGLVVVQRAHGISRDDESRRPRW